MHLFWEGIAFSDGKADMLSTAICDNKGLQTYVVWLYDKAV